jgi:hypothetical protein
LAAAVYDDIDSDQKSKLSAHLVKCSACRTQFESMRRLTEFVPKAAPALDLDLLPLLRKETRPARRPVARLGWAWSLAAATVFVIAALALNFIPNTGQSADIASLSSLEKQMRTAETLIQDRQFGSAYKTLQQAVAQNQQDPNAGLALARMADVAFTNLNWYPEACEAYDQLAKKYPAIYSSHPECIFNHNCLLETRDHDFAPLYALDAAHRSGDEQFAQLEKVVGRYPGTFVAAMAVDDMAKVAADELASRDPGLMNDDDAYVAALVCAKDRCCNPIAAARLKLELAHVYMREMNDAKMARSFYREVAESGDLELAGLAQDGLAKLDGAE